MTPHSHTAVGIVITVASTVLYNLGFVIEKGALADLPEVHARRLVHLLQTIVSSPRWLLGFAAMLGGLGLQIVALSLIPISVVQPVFVSGIVVLLVLSHLSLGERLRRQEWAGVGLVALSLLLISLSLSAAADRAGTGGTIVGIATAGVPTVLCALGVFVVADRTTGSWRIGAQLRPLLYGVAAGLIYGVAALATKDVSSMLERHGLVAGLPHVLATPAIYIVGGTSAVGLVLFQTALQRCPASVIVPVSNVISSTYVVGVGTALFGEQLPAASWQVAMRLGGFAGVLLAMVLLAGAKSPSDRFGDAPLYGDPVLYADPVATDPPPVASAPSQT